MSALVTAGMNSKNAGYEAIITFGDVLVIFGEGGGTQHGVGLGLRCTNRCTTGVEKVRAVI
jgi:hypothetical protein